MKYLALLSFLLVTPVLANGKHHNPPPPVNVVNNYDDDSNRNVIYLGVAIAAGVCIYHKCWKQKPVQDKDPTRITPELKQQKIIIRPKQ